MNAADHFVVPRDLDGERADLVVARLLGVSRSAAKNLCARGDVVADGRPVAPSARLPAGARLDVTMPQEAAFEPAPVDFGVLYEDDEVIVVDKPAGVVVHPGAGNVTGTLVNGLVHRYPDLAALGEEHRWGLVHRLDRGTSGALLVARTPEAHRRLQQELRERRIEREYLALVAGHVAAATGTIDAPLDRDPRRPTRRAVVRDGRPARTHYRRIAAWDDVTLVEVHLETGRTHQIRVHFSSIGHPVVGDRTYGRALNHRAEPGRVWLHARRLAFEHPGGGRVEVTAPLPEPLRASLERLGPPRAGDLADVELGGRSERAGPGGL